MYDIIIKNGMLYDGTGEKPYAADLGIVNGRIETIGSLTEEAAGRVLDAEGCVVCPGFIDMHSHADLNAIRFPDAENLIGMGITTVFSGHCGMGMAPVGEYWKPQSDDVFAMEAFMPFASAGFLPGRPPVCSSAELRRAFREYFGAEMNWTSFGEFMEELRKKGTAVNYAMEVGLQQVRQSVLGRAADRSATDEEIVRMQEHIREAMEAGAFGMSIGYDYTPDLSASEKELEALAAVVKEYDGIVAAHTRNGKDNDPDWLPGDGIREFLDLGRRTGARLHISHIHQGCSMRETDRKVIDSSNREVMQWLEQGRKEGLRITWDVLHPGAASFYYYPQACSALLYYILECGGKRTFSVRLQDETYLGQLAECIHRREHILFPPLQLDAPVISCSCEEYLGKTARELAQAADVSPEEMLLRILAQDVQTCVRPLLPNERLKDEKGTIDTCEYFWLREDAAIGTDNPCMDYDYEGMRPDLPSFRGTPPAYCGFVTMLLESDRRSIPLEKTIRKLTGNAAEILGLKDRGLLRVGQQADVVVFDRGELSENINYLDPRQQPSGLHYVLVNGQVASDHGRHTHVRSGAILNFRGQRSKES